jgi:hypothetical protein
MLIQDLLHHNWENVHLMRGEESSGLTKELAGWPSEWETLGKYDPDGLVTYQEKLFNVSCRKVDKRIRQYLFPKLAHLPCLAEGVKSYSR